MSSRDPETGQFTSGATAVEYRDHEVQHVRATFRDNGIGSNDAYSLQDVVEVEPPADRRKEEAELVALLIHNVRAEIDALPGSNADGLRAGWEISRDEDIGPLTQFRNEVDLQQNAFETTGQGPQAALSRQIVLDDMDPLWFALLRTDGYPSSRDNQRAGPFYIDYRKLTGGGPVFSGGDSVHFHGRVNAVGLDVNWVSDIQTSLVWSVTDRD